MAQDVHTPSPFNISNGNQSLLQSDNGVTDYGMTKRQRRKMERTTFSQKDRNLHKRKMKQQRRKRADQERLDALSEEERAQHRSDRIQERERNRKLKEVQRGRVEEASKTGMRICIDLGFNKMYKKDMEYTNVECVCCLRAAQTLTVLGGPLPMTTDHKATVLLLERQQKCQIPGGIALL